MIDIFIILSTLICFNSCYDIRDDTECAGIEGLRTEFSGYNVSVKCGLKPDGKVGTIIDISDSGNYLFNLTSDDTYDLYGVSIGNAGSELNPMYLEYAIENDTMARRTSDYVRIQRHDKRNQHGISFVSDVGSTVLSDWMSRLIDWILTKFQNAWSGSTTFYEHGFYFEIRTHDDTPQQLKTLESAIDEFFRQHKWLCYSYCLKFTHENGHWSAFIKIYREDEDNIYFQCDTPNQFSPGCDYLSSGDRAGQM